MYETEIDTRAGTIELDRRLEDPDRRRVEISETATEKDAALRQLINEMIDVTHRQHRAPTELRLSRRQWSASLDRLVEVGRARPDRRRRRPGVVVAARVVRVAGRGARVVEAGALRKTVSSSKTVSIREAGVRTRRGAKS